jgi:hypothetical protein
VGPARGGGPPVSGPAFKFPPNQTISAHFVKFESGLKEFDLPVLQKFEIKYGWKGLEIRNNFPYRNLLRFKLDFK